jgi:outer membrane protein TolC
MKRLGAVLLCAALCAARGFGQSGASIEELAAMGAANNLELQKARRALQNALEELMWTSDLADTRIDLSGGYSREPAGELSGQATLTVPIIPQVSLAASVSSEGSGSASVKVSPFATGDARYLLVQAYNKAALDLSYATQKLGFDIQAAACAEVQARTALALAEAKLALEEQKAAAAESRYTMGQLSYEDLDSERANLIAARQGRFDAERGLLSARVALYRLLGPSTTETEVKGMESGELEASIASRDAMLESLGGSEPATLALRQSTLDLQALKEQLAQTWVYRPNLDISAGLAYQPASASPLAASASLSLSFSPSDIKTEDRAEILQSIADKEKEVALERLASRFQEQILRQALAVAKQALATRQTELEQAQSAVAGGEVLLSQGRWTSLEMEQARINVESAKAGVFSASAAVLKAQTDILLVYGR